MQLTAENLACERGGRTVFSNQNFSLGSGELLQLTGPNGSGKSSLLRLLANLSEPSHGKISLEGGAPELTPGQQAHYIAHSDASKSALTVTENLNFLARLPGRRRSHARLAGRQSVCPCGLSCGTPLRRPEAPSWRSQDWRLSLAPSGCSMNPAWDWMNPPRNCSQA